MTDDGPGPWYRLELGDGLLSAEALDRLRYDFEAWWDGEERPENASAWVRHESEGRLHCETVVYLSPGASGFAARVHAEACPRPGGSGLGRVAGAGWVVGANSTRTGCDG